MRRGRTLLPKPLLPYLMAIRRPAGLVFTDENGERENDDRVRRRARRTWEAAGLAPIVLHEARHACATFLIYAGLNIKEVFFFDRDPLRAVGSHVLCMAFPTQ